MKSLSLALALLLPLGLAACGDKGGDGSGGYGGGSSKASSPVGSWGLDLDKFFDANKDLVMAGAEAGFAQAEEGLKALANLPAEQKAEMTKQMLEQVPAEHRDVMEAFLRSPAEGRALSLKKAKEQMKSLSYDVEMKADKTWTAKGAGHGPVENSAGTWSLEGDQVTIVTTTKNDKPAAGDDAKSFKATLKGDTLTGKPDERGPVVVLKRK